jgi:branched-subunit amino acid transport protein
MMSELALWSISIAVGVGTFAMRLSFIGLHGRWRIPPLLQRAMAYIPASVLAALVLPAVVLPGGHGDFAFANPQIPAALVAALVAWWTRSTVLTLVAGMAMLWGLKLLGG